MRTSVFTFADAITTEEKAVMYAVVARTTSQIEDGTVKGINKMLVASRKSR